MRTQVHTQQIVALGNYMRWRDVAFELRERERERVWWTNITTNMFKETHPK